MGTTRIERPAEKLKIKKKFILSHFFPGVYETAPILHFLMHFQFFDFSCPVQPEITQSHETFNIYM